MDEDELLEAEDIEKFSKAQLFDSFLVMMEERNESWAREGSLLRQVAALRDELAQEQTRNTSYMGEIQRLRAGIGRSAAKFAELLEGGIKTAFEIR